MNRRRLSVFFGAAAFLVVTQACAGDRASSPSMGVPVMRSAGEGTIETATVIETLKSYINGGNFIEYNNYFGPTVLLPILQGKLSSGPISTFLIELWEKKTDRHPELNWKVASEDRFRILVAAELLLAVSAWDLRYDTKDVHAYVRSKITDENPFVVMNALFALSVKKDESDVPLLKTLISKSGFGAFSQAVRTLAHICHPDAERALEDLARTEKSGDRKRHIEETRDKFYRSKGPEHYCPPSVASRGIAEAAEHKQPAPRLSAESAKLVEETIGKLKDLINRSDANGFFEYVAHWIPVRFYREKIPTKQMAGFYIELWEKRTERHPELDWKVVGKDEFRFVLARTLMDMVRDERLRYDTTEMRAYLRSIVAHDDEVVAGNALLALRVEGQESDIPLLKERALRSGPTEFKTAIRMLAGICGPKAKQALEELIKTEQLDARKRYIEEALRDFYKPDGRFFNCRR